MDELPKAHVEIPLIQAALRIRESYHCARTMMLRGDLRGRQVGRLWYVREEDVARLESERQTRVGRLA